MKLFLKELYQVMGYSKWHLLGGWIFGLLVHIRYGFDLSIPITFVLVAWAYQIGAQNYLLSIKNNIIDRHQNLMFRFTMLFRANQEVLDSVKKMTEKESSEEIHRIVSRLAFENNEVLNTLKMLENVSERR